MKTPQVWPLSLQPFGRRGFQVLHQVRHGERARQTNGQMHMVRHAARSMTFTPGIARHRRQIRVEFGQCVVVKQSAPILRAEDDVDDHEA